MLLSLPPGHNMATEPVEVQPKDAASSCRALSSFSRRFFRTVWPEHWNLVPLSVWKATIMRLCVCGRGGRLESWKRDIKPVCLWHLPQHGRGIELCLCASNRVTSSIYRDCISSGDGRTRRCGLKCSSRWTAFQLVASHFWGIGKVCEPVTAVGGLPVTQLLAASLEIVSL